MIVQQTYVSCGIRPKNVQDFAKRSHFSPATVLRIARKPGDIRRIVFRPTNDARNIRKLPLEHRKMALCLPFIKRNKMNNDGNPSTAVETFLGRGAFLKGRKLRCYFMQLHCINTLLTGHPKVSI